MNSFWRRAQGDRNFVEGHILSEQRKDTIQNITIIIKQCLSYYFSNNCKSINENTKHMAPTPALLSQQLSGIDNSDAELVEIELIKSLCDLLESYLCHKLKNNQSIWNLIVLILSPKLLNNNNNNVNASNNNNNDQPQQSQSQFSTTSTSSSSTTTPPQLVKSSSLSFFSNLASSIKTSASNISLSTQTIIPKSPEDTEYWSNQIDCIQSLSEVVSNIGRFRALLRRSLNEKTIIQLIDSIANNNDILKNYYEEDSMMKYKEDSDVFRSMLASLDPISFDIDYNDPLLNSLDYMADTPLCSKTIDNTTTTIETTTTTTTTTTSPSESLNNSASNISTTTITVNDGNGSNSGGGNNLGVTSELTSSSPNVELNSSSSDTNVVVRKKKIIKSLTRTIDLDIAPSFDENSSVNSLDGSSDSLANQPNTSTGSEKIIKKKIVKRIIKTKVNQSSTSSSTTSTSPLSLTNSNNSIPTNSSSNSLIDLDSNNSNNNNNTITTKEEEENQINISLNTSCSNVPTTATTTTSNIEIPEPELEKEKEKEIQVLVEEVVIAPVIEEKEIVHIEKEVVRFDIDEAEKEKEIEICHVDQKEVEKEKVKQEEFKFIPADDDQDQEDETVEKEIEKLEITEPIIEKEIEKTTTTTTTATTRSSSPIGFSIDYASLLRQYSTDNNIDDGEISNIASVIIKSSDSEFKYPIEESTPINNNRSKPNQLSDSSSISFKLNVLLDQEEEEEDRIPEPFPDDLTLNEKVKEQQQPSQQAFQPPSTISISAYVNTPPSPTSSLSSSPTLSSTSSTSTTSLSSTLPSSSGSSKIKNIKSPVERQLLKEKSNSNLNNLTMIDNYSNETDVIKRKQEEQRDKRYMKEIHAPRKRLHFTIITNYSLKDQDFKCAGCNRDISGLFSSSRLCDYSGKYFCSGCHDKSVYYNPSRIIQQWDFKKYAISKVNLEFLQSIEKEPLIDLFSLNAQLYKNPILLKIRNLRKQMYHLKDFLITCKSGSGASLYQYCIPSNVDYLVKDIELFSIYDLVNHKALWESLRQLVAKWLDHVDTCTLCQAKGSICEFCNSDTPIYPYHISTITQCSNCKSISHKSCYHQIKCPKCIRNAKLRLKQKDEKEKQQQLLLKQQEQQE